MSLNEGRAIHTALTSVFTGIADRVKNFAVVYVCDIDQVPDFNKMYELYDPVTLMFFFRNKHMMCDFGTGNNNKLNWVLEDKQELIDIIETYVKRVKLMQGERLTCAAESIVVRRRVVVLSSVQRVSYQICLRAQTHANF